MVALAYDFENGVDEAAVVGSDPTGSANDATDVDVGAGAELDYDAAKSGARGGMAARFATGPTSAVARWEWTVSGTDHFGRCYLYIDAASWAAVGEPVRLCNADGSRIAGVRVNISRIPQLIDALGANVAVGTALAVGQWHRIELDVDMAADDAEMRIYSGANLHGTTPSQTLAAPAAASFAGTASFIAFGQTTGGANVGPAWIDEIAYSDTASPGAAPDLTPAPTTVKVNTFENVLAEGTLLTPANTAYSGADALSEVVGDVRVRTRAVGDQSRYAAFTAGASGGSTRDVPSISLVAAVGDADATGVASFLVSRYAESIRIAQLSTGRRKPSAAVVLATDGRLQVRDRDNEVLGTSADPVPDGQWFRVRLRATNDATTPADNLIEVEIYHAEADTTPTETLSFPAAEVAVLGRALTTFTVGILTPVKSVTTLAVDGVALGAPTPAAPTYTSLDRISGPAGTTVIWKGTELAGTTNVRVGAVNALFNVINPTTLSLVIPDGAVTGRIYVITPGGVEESGVDFTVTSTVAEDIVVTDVTPGSGHIPDNSLEYEIPSMEFVEGALYDLIIAAYEAGNSAEVQTPETPGLTWEPIVSHASGPNSLGAWRCRPAATVTAATKVTFSKQHEGAQYLVGRYDKTDGSGTNGSGAIGGSDAAAPSTGAARAELEIPDFLTGAKHTGVLVVHTNVAEAITPESPGVGRGEVQGDMGTTGAILRTLKKIAAADDPLPAGGWVTPALYRALAYTIKPGSAVGSGGGGGGGGGAGRPQPNTEPNPTPDLTLTAPMSADAVNAAIAGISGGPVGKKIKFVGTFDFNKRIKTYDDMWIFGTQGSPARFKAAPYGQLGNRSNPAANAYCFSKLDDARRVTISDVEIDGWSLRAMVPWIRWTIRRFEFHHCAQNGIGGVTDHVSPFLVLDTGRIHHCGNIQNVGDTPGGTKFLETGLCGAAIGSGVSYFLVESDHNIGPGFWWDHTCAGDQALDCYSHDNTRSGFRYEIGAGPFLWKWDRAQFNGVVRSGHTYGFDDKTPSELASSIGGGVRDGFNVTSTSTGQIISCECGGNGGAGIKLTEEERAVLRCPNGPGGYKRGYFFDHFDVLGNILNGDSYVTNKPGNVTYDPTPI